MVRYKWRVRGSIGKAYICPGVNEEFSVVIEVSASEEKELRIAVSKLAMAGIIANDYEIEGMGDAQGPVNDFIDLLCGAVAKDWEQIARVVKAEMP